MSIAKCRSCGQQYLPDSPEEDIGLCADCRSLVTIPPTVAPTVGPTLTKSIETISPIPLFDFPTLPGYEILGELGRGGMGVVYKAKQSALNRIVALKVILVGVHASVGERNRFRTEAETVARLQHPNILHIHELSEWTVPGTNVTTPYLSLEFCGGGNLEARIRGKPLAPALAAQLVEVLARAIQHAHEGRVVHRDLKPANILFTESGIPKVADFGMAKILGEQGHTKTGEVMGTPSYMAPEQASGKSKESGPATDVYALGAILFECLTGRPPYRGETTLDTLLAVVNDPLPALPAGTPEPLQAICQRCLMKKPGERYPTARALADDLRRWLTGQRIEGGSTVPAARRGAKDWFIGAGLTALVVLVMVMAAVVWWKLASGKTAPPKGAGFRPAFRLPNREGVVLEFAIAAPLHSLAVSPDGRHLASGGIGTIRVWDLENRRVAQEWKADSKESPKIHTLAYSSDGTRLLSLAEDGRPRIWDPESGKAVATLRTFAPVRRACWIGTEDAVVTATDSGRIELFAGGEWDSGSKVANSAGIISLVDAASRPGSLQFALVGRFSIVGTSLIEGSQLQLEQLPTGKGRSLLPTDLGKGNEYRLTCCAFSADGRTLVLGEEGGKVRLWHPDTGKLLFTFDGWGKAIQSVVCSPKGNRALVADGGGAIHLIDLTSHTEALVSARDSKLAGLAFSPDGRHAVLADSDGVVRVVGLPERK